VMLKTKRISKPIVLLGVLLGSLIGFGAVLIPAPEGIGLAGLSVFFIIVIFFVYWQSYPELRTVLISAFLLWAALALIHIFVFPLPDSQADAISFELTGWKLAEGWRAGESFELITGADFYSFIIGLVYYVLDRSPLFIQALNVLFGTLLVYVVAVISRELFNSRVALLAAWVSCFFPACLLYSAITLREVAIVFPFALAILYFIRWLKKTSRVYDLIKSALCLFVSSLFHTGIIFLLGVLLLFWFYSNLDDFVRLRIRLFVVKALVGLLLLGILSIILTTGIGLEKVGGKVTQLLDPEYLGARHKIQARGRAAYLTDLVITSPTDLVHAVPLKIVYFLFAPFPWEITTLVDVVGMVDGLFYLGLIVAGVYGLLQIRRQHGKLVFWGLVLILVTGIAIFAMGTGNYGTALRHRAKFVFLLIVLASPIMYGLWYWYVSKLKL